MENNKNTIQVAKKCEIQEGMLCAYHCRDCRHLEDYIDGQGKRRCAYLGRWVYPSDNMCGYGAP